MAVVVDFYPVLAGIEELQTPTAVLDAHVFADALHGEDAVGGGEEELAIFLGEGNHDVAFLDR